MSDQVKQQRKVFFHLYQAQVQVQNLFFGFDPTPECLKSIEKVLTNTLDLVQGYKAIHTVPPV